ncbi:MULTISPECIES: hypothetical protein, partial [Paraburkholderia]|uniref:hypothetical protein n=1 Tax=Paraburkholderia TaxID=1822464 RepID=UPI0038BA35DC
MLIAMKLSPYGVKPDLCFFLPSAACSWGPMRVLRGCGSFLWVCRKVKHKLGGGAIGLCACSAGFGLFFARSGWGLPDGAGFGVFAFGGGRLPVRRLLSVFLGRWPFLALLVVY